MKQKIYLKTFHYSVLYFESKYSTLLIKLYIKHSDNGIMSELVYYNKQIFLKLLPLRYFPQNGVLICRSTEYTLSARKALLDNLKHKFTPVILVHCSYYTFICIPLLFVREKPQIPNYQYLIIVFHTYRITFYTER